MKKVVFRQVLPISTGKAWEFFSDPRNLGVITPPSMDFRIIKTLPKTIYPGMLIEYKVSPLLGISMEWITEITHVNAPYYFVDEQRKGPYKIWHHEHHFRETPNGVEMTDILWYNIPLGVLGKLIDNLLVNRKVIEIFAYRKKKLEELFEAEKPTDKVVII